MKVTKERIDFILVSPVLSTMCIDAKIFNIGEIGYLSDQYPVQEVFNWAGSE